MIAAVEKKTVVSEKGLDSGQQVVHDEIVALTSRHLKAILLDDEEFFGEVMVSFHKGFPATVHIGQTFKVVNGHVT